MTGDVIIEGEVKARSKMDYQTTIMFQVDRVMRLSSTIPFSREGHNVSNLNDIITAYKYSVANLASLLKPYLDKEYISELKKLKQKDPYRYRMEQFGLIMEQLSRLNVLLDEIGTWEVGIDEQ